MKTAKNKRAVIVGIFIFLGLVILVATIFTLGGQKKTFVKSISINATFNDVNGLLKGANIWLAGVKVGTVKQISFSGKSQVTVTMSIEKDAAPFIHKNAAAKIGSDGLIGNKIVIIYGGDASTLPVEKGDFLRVENAISTDDMMTTLQANNKNLLAITNDFKSVSKKLDSGNGMIPTLLNDPALAMKLNNTIDNLQSAIANFRTVSVNSTVVLANLQDFSGKLNKPGNSLNELVSDTGMYTSVKGTLSELNNAAGSLTKFSSNLNILSGKLNQKGNTLDVLLTDTAAASSLKNTLKNLDAGSQTLDDDLLALQHNIFLRGFFKKREKAAKKQNNTNE
ncbi:MAG: MlaD family protein [Ferruginibacter sp.]